MRLCKSVFTAVAQAHCFGCKHSYYLSHTLYFNAIGDYCKGMGIRDNPYALLSGSEFHKKRGHTPFNKGVTGGADGRTRTCAYGLASQCSTSELLPARVPICLHSEKPWLPYNHDVRPLNYPFEGERDSNPHLRAAPIKYHCNAIQKPPINLRAIT